MDHRPEAERAEQERRLARYDDLLRSYAAAAGERPFDELLDFVAREAARAMRADRASIFLLNPERGELWARVALGVGDEVIRFPADRGIAGHVVRTGEPLNVPDPYADPRFNPAVDRQTGYRTRGILCAPLRARAGRVIGALQVLNKLDGGPFTAEDERLAAALARRCAAAIENALLYEQLRAAGEGGPRPPGGAPTVLLADDDALLLPIVAEALGEEVRVVQALDGEEALRQVRAGPPDVLLLDLNMPGPGGLEVCRALRSAPATAELPIIVVTGSRRLEDVVRAFEVGANDYVVKPFSLGQLRAKTHTWLLRAARPGA
jgi:CheY-like chemotaxis protein